MHPRDVSVTRLSYDERLYENAKACLLGIRHRVELGWQITELRESGGGYRVVFRMEHVAESEAALGADGPDVARGIT